MSVYVLSLLGGLSLDFRLVSYPETLTFCCVQNKLCFCAYLNFCCCSKGGSDASSSSLQPQQKLESTLLFWFPPKSNSSSLQYSVVCSIGSIFIFGFTCMPIYVFNVLHMFLKNKYKSFMDLVINKEIHVDRKLYLLFCSLLFEREFQLSHSVCFLFLFLETFFHTFVWNEKRKERKNQKSKWKGRETRVTQTKTRVNVFDSC